MMKNGILPTVSTLIPKPLRSILKHKRERTLQNINDMYLTLKQYILSALNLFAELQSVFFLSCTRLINTQRERLDWRGPFLIFFVNSYRCFGLKRLHKISKSRRCAYIIEIKTVYEWPLLLFCRQPAVVRGDSRLCQVHRALVITSAHAYYNDYKLPQSRFFYNTIRLLAYSNTLRAFLSFLLTPFPIH